MAHYAPLRRGFSFGRRRRRNTRSRPGGRYSVTMDGILIGAAVLCVVALALLLTVKIEPR